MKAQLFALAITLAQTSSAAVSVTACDVFLADQFLFESQSKTVSESGRKGIQELSARIRKGNFCPLGHILVVGYADTSEEEMASTLAIERANEVRALLMENGLPNNRIHIESKALPPDPHLNWQRVEVSVYGGCPSDHCPYPVGDDGFRSISPPQ